jgi:hypothetical protein
MNRLARTIGSGGTGFVLVLACIAAHAQPLPKESDLRKRDAFLRLYAQTASCMREASVAAMRYGRPVDRADVVRFTNDMCGEGLHGWLTREEHMTDKQASALLNAMGYKALDAAVRGPDAIIIR